MQGNKGSYQGFYINLERSVRRREALEQRLSESGLAGKYLRFPAIDGSAITYGPDAARGTTILGCTLSHLSVIKSQLGKERHIHVLEDDAVLHNDIDRVFEKFVEVKRDDEWDILMTDIFLPPDLYLFKFLHERYQKLSATGSISFLDIGSWEFAGASSYFVNKRSMDRFLQMMEHAFPPETPYDLRIRELAKRGELKVFACFPFFSTVSELSSESTISGDFTHVLPLTEYRRAFYVSADLKAIAGDLEALCTEEADTLTRIYLNLVRCLVSPQHEAF
ncbi:glycosyltransferase family 25 protein [Geomonas oryzae]|uniref:glycosyltransferase family 25 protein n=1 Tax=Geomonas oryzae TaxID=2364273 RepID=UPI00100BDE14|nr:glycosyltransferase family 25 protein [Geomonas oryzae]